MSGLEQMLQNEAHVGIGTIVGLGAPHPYVSLIAANPGVAGRNWTTRAPDNREPVAQLLGTDSPASPYRLTKPAG
jgi:hypothetical protein